MSSRTPRSGEPGQGFLTFIRRIEALARLKAGLTKWWWRDGVELNPGR